MLVLLDGSVVDVELHVCCVVCVVVACVKVG
jgi:hypothetical protein